MDCLLELPFKFLHIKRYIMMHVNSNGSGFYCHCRAILHISQSQIKIVSQGSLSAWLSGPDKCASECHRRMKLLSHLVKIRLSITLSSR